MPCAVLPCTRRVRLTVLSQPPLLCSCPTCLYFAKTSSNLRNGLMCVSCSKCVVSIASHGSLTPSPQVIAASRRLICDISEEEKRRELKDIADVYVCNPQRQNHLQALNDAACLRYGQNNFEEFMEDPKCRYRSAACARASITDACAARAGSLRRNDAAAASWNGIAAG